MTERTWRTRCDGATWVVIDPWGNERATFRDAADAESYREWKASGH